MNSEANRTVMDHSMVPKLDNFRCLRAPATLVLVLIACLGALCMPASNAQSCDFLSIQRELSEVRRAANELQSQSQEARTGQSISDLLLPEEAKNHIGEHASVRGLIVQVSFSRRGNAFLNFSQRWPRQPFCGFVRSNDVERVGDKAFLRSLQGGPVTVTDRSNSTRVARRSSLLLPGRFGRLFKPLVHSARSRSLSRSSGQDRAREERI